MYFTITKTYFNYKIYLFVIITLLFPKSYFSQIGTWSQVVTIAPYASGGVMLLMTDGTVLVKTNGGGGDGIGNIWSRLTPDIHGSYANGSWSLVPPMNDTRLYFSSRILRDGRLYIAGGEYGTGKAHAEIYDPLFDYWLITNPLNPGDSISDANSELLPDGRVLQALVESTTFGYKGNVIYDPKTNQYTPAPACHNSHDESSWVKLPDNSILFVDLGATSSERYIPSLNQWLVDATVPLNLYDPYAYETGGAFMLPNGQAFFIGGSGKTAYYTPSGTPAHGTWTAGPNVPNNNGAVDAAAAMMANGKLLCAFSPTPSSNVIDSMYKSPTYFYEFDYTTNTFTSVPAPDGSSNIDAACYTTNMLDLPDGTVLYSTQGSSQYYIYTPNGIALTSGKPTINTITQKTCDSLRLTGTLFNGISEGAGYGDDWQMATNYPIVRLTNGTNVYYAHTYNWNSDGIQRGSLADTTYCTLPIGLPHATYSLVVTANGISSDPINFTYCTLGLTDLNSPIHPINIYPNPGSQQIQVEFTTSQTSAYVLTISDLVGREMIQDKGISNSGINAHSVNIAALAKGIYQVTITQGISVYTSKLVVN